MCRYGNTGNDLKISGGNPWSAARTDVERIPCAGLVRVQMSMPSSDVMSLRSPFAGGHLHSPLSFGDFGYGYAPFALFSLPLDRVMGTDAGKISMCKVSQDADDVGCVTNAPDGPTECPMDRFLCLLSSFSCFVSVTA